MTTNPPPPGTLQPDQPDDLQEHAASTSIDHPHIIYAASDLNTKHASENQDVSVSFSPPNASSETASNVSQASIPPQPSRIEFRSTTIAPSPPLPDDESVSASRRGQRHESAPLGTSPIRGQTDESAPPTRRELSPPNTHLSSQALQRKASSSSLKPVSRTPSVKTTLANSIGSASGASSVVPSPIISAMGDVTPLPSPLLSADSPGPWKRLGGSLSPTGEGVPAGRSDTVLVTSNGESIASALAHAARRKQLAVLGSGDGERNAAEASQDHPHARNRSVSDYVPDPLGIPKRHGTVSGSRAAGGDGDVALEPHMRREANLAEARGLTSSITQPPTPPPSESSKEVAEAAGTDRSKSSRHIYFEAYGRLDGKKRRWRAVTVLGQGTFSRVLLATSQIGGEDDVSTGRGDSDSSLAPSTDGYPDRKTLVAVKVCEQGPLGGASQDRIEMSLKRELEIMKSIHHPSLVQLKAWNIEPTRAILVLSYCAGGDLFDVATSHRDALVPALLRRMFAELVGAVRYLHGQRIVHRDIKLENVLVNIPAAELARPSVDWAEYPYSLVTLTDLGLSRRIEDGEKLTTRCGSDDYAAPEVIMGQPYDGRAIDAWSLGVLLYALLEARLPFDPHPGMSESHRMRSRTSHRIARVEWRWVEYGGDDGDHEASLAKFTEQDLLGAMEITEGLLKRARSRWALDKVAESRWVRGAMNLPDGLMFREEQEGEEVL